MYFYMKYKSDSLPYYADKRNNTRYIYGKIYDDNKDIV